MLRGLVAVLLATQSAATGVARAPHLVYVLLDDFGWAEAGFKNASAEVRTPRSSPRSAPPPRLEEAQQIH